MKDIKTVEREYEKQGITSREYNLIHNWLKQNYGKANKCENIDCENKSKTYDWCLITDKNYEFNRNNFLMLCRSCHMKYDPSNKRGCNGGHNKLKIKNSKGQVFESIIEASKKTNTNRSSIQAVLSGVYKTANKLKWYYYEE